MRKSGPADKAGLYGALTFELVKKPIQYCDIATKKLKRKSEITKNELMREMIETCIRNDLKFRFCLMNSCVFF